MGGDEKRHGTKDGTEDMDGDEKYELLDWHGNEKETKNLAQDSEKVGSRMCNAVGWGRRDGWIDRDRKERRK